MFSVLVTIAALMTAAAADPAVIISNGLLSSYASSPLTSAALVAPAAGPVVAPVASVPSIGSIPALAVPYTSVSDYRYSYGSSLNYQDYVPAAVSAPLTLPYNLPYAYAADWYYRNL